MVKDSNYYILAIIKDIEFVINNLKDISLDEFDNDELLNSAISFKFVQIAENANKIDKDFISMHNEIPWAKIKGLRNKIVHDYGEILFYMVYDTAKENLPELLIQLKELIKP